MHAARTDGDPAADGHREVALLGQRARNLEQRAGLGRPLTAGRDRDRTIACHPHAQPFDGAAEEHFLDFAEAHEVRADLRFVGTELDFLRPQHGDDLARHRFAGGDLGIESHGGRRPVAEQQVRGTEERRDEAGLRPRIEIVRPAAFEQAALVHHADAIGQRERFFLVVRDEDGRHAELALDLADRAAQFLADLGVERTEGLVHQQHLRPVRECARHRDALLLAARELGRQAVVHALERDQAQQLLAARTTLGSLHLAHAQRELDVVADRHVAEQRVMLEDEADLALARGHVRHVPAVQEDAAVVDLGQAGDGPQQRALAAAARAQQHQEFALLDLERDVIDDRYRLIPLGHLVEDDGHAEPVSAEPGRPS